MNKKNKKNQKLYLIYFIVAVFFLVVGIIGMIRDSMMAYLFIGLGCSNACLGYVYFANAKKTREKNK